MTPQQPYDYIIVGSGIAGLYTALAAQEHGSVLLLTKGGIEDCNTRFAQGGIAAAIGPEDSPEYHLEDTLAAGAGLCNEEAVRILAFDGPRAIADLVRLGMVFDTTHGEVALGREAAHRMPRVLHAGGDETGARIELTMARLSRMSNVHIEEYVDVTRLLVSAPGGRVVGVEALNAATGELGEHLGLHVVLATGGGGRLYRYTTNPEVATGDGVSLAFRAGAAVMDLEFFQFHPTALHKPGAPPFLISEAVRGEGGVLRNAAGEAFMERYHPMKDLAPRDVVSRAIRAEMERAGSDHVALDVTHLPPQLVATRFPSIYSTCLENGLDITREPVPVAPAAHYMMGGVLTNTWGETTLPGLYACGEVTSNGLHGANRLASNSLLETVVFGRRLVHRTVEGGADGPRPRDAVPLPRRDVAVPAAPPTVDHVRALMWDMVGMTRDEDGLRTAAETLSGWEQALPEPRDRPSHELRNMALVARIMAEAALMRTESRGAHYRTDYPETSAGWERHIVIVPSE